MSELRVVFDIRGFAVFFGGALLGCLIGLSFSLSRIATALETLVAK